MEIVALQGEDFFDRVLDDKPRLEALSATRPWARPHLIVRTTRRADPVLRAVFTLYVWAQQVLNSPPLHRPTPPCLACGLPTGNFCDVCAENGEPGATAKAVCTDCEPDDLACRDCVSHWGAPAIREFITAFHTGRAHWY
jgi:hypothetical protein